MIGPDTHLVEVIADGEVAEYIVSGDMFTERSQCAPDFWQKSVRPINVGEGAKIPPGGGTGAAIGWAIH